MSSNKSSLDGLKEKMVETAQLVNDYITARMGDIAEVPHPSMKALVESMAYSSQNGGKRFRPVLSLLTGELLGVSTERVLAFGTAVELIHTSSLIHADLPCMDDDDERRGQPTNHKVYGEDVALIAGDGLLTEAFYLLGKYYQDNPQLACQLVLELSQAAGHRGMIGGQAIDIKAQKKGIRLEEINLLHELKTGALIKVAVRGAALIAASEDKASAEEVERLSKFGALIGLAFQVKDDILDLDEENPELGNFTTVQGLEKTEEYLSELTQEGMEQVKSWGEKACYLEEMLQYNQNRSK